MDASIIACNDFRFCPGEAPILDHINFQLQPGQWLSILGPNGAGKTTLLKSLLGIFGKQEKILINNKPQSFYSRLELARVMAWMPQDNIVSPQLKVEEFLEMSQYARLRQGLKPSGQSLRLAQEIAGQDLHKSLSRFSGGELRKVMLAAAVAQETPILLLDEPGAFLDPHAADQMINELKELQNKHNKTIIIVCHDLALHLATGGLSLVLANGRQLYFGKSENLASNGVLEHAFQHHFSWIEHPLTHKPVPLA